MMNGTGIGVGRSLWFIRNMSFWSSKLCSLSNGRIRNSLKRGADGALYSALLMVRMAFFCRTVNL